MKKQVAVKAIATGVLRFGDVEVECYVLEDGRRMISGRGGQRALGLGANEGHFERRIGRIVKENGNLTMGPSSFVLPHGGARANGYEAEQFLDVCAAYVDALSRGTLHHKQVHVARAATGVLRNRTNWA